MCQAGGGLTPCVDMLNAVRPNEVDKVDEVDWRRHRGECNCVSMTKRNSRRSISTGWTWPKRGSGGAWHPPHDCLMSSYWAIYHAGVFLACIYCFGVVSLAFGLLLPRLSVQPMYIPGHPYQGVARRDLQKGQC